MRFNYFLLHYQQRQVTKQKCMKATCLSLLWISMSLYLCNKYAKNDYKQLDCKLYKSCTVTVKGKTSKGKDKNIFQERNVFGSFWNVKTPYPTRPDHVFYLKQVIASEYKYSSCKIGHSTLNWTVTTTWCGAFHFST